MTNRVTLVGKVLDAPKVRSFDTRGATVETVSLWIETRTEDRADRFTVEINCPKAAASATPMRAGVLAEVNGVLRHDRWKDKKNGQWTGKVYVAIDPGAGALRSKGMAPEAKAPEEQAG